MLLLLPLLGCGSAEVSAGTRDNGVRFSAPAADTLRLLIAERVAESPGELFTDEHKWEHVRAIYESRDHQPIWMGAREREQRAGTLLRHLAEAHHDGLRPQEYPLERLEQRMEALRAPTASPRDAVDTELLLTAVFASYGEDMLTGRINPRRVEQSWHIDPNEVDVDSALVRVARSDDFEEALRALRPQDEDYAALRRELVRYREIADRGGWRPVPSGSVLTPGDSSDRVPAVRARLQAEGFLRDGTVADSHHYDREVAGAVNEFQRYYGIAVDSALGPETRGAMNVSLERRILQIEANMERWRWLPHAFGSRYLLVNVPAFQLQAYEAGEQVMSMSVIVGEEYTETPVFADSMSYLEFYPYWHIPMNIARRDILPRAAGDPGYLARNGYEIVREWSNDAQPIPVSSLSRSQLRPGNFSHRLRQRPGPSNSLGLVKFMFPNEFAIYLHDTPGEQLFQERVRAFSNGCIRVEHPVELAEWVLQANGGWDTGRIRSAMQGPTKRVDLERKVPIYIVYLTSYVSGGRMHFRQDIYGRDAALMDALGVAIPDQRASSRAERLAALLE